MQRLAGIELGGTKCIAVLGHGPQILETRRFPTTTPDETLSNVLSVIKQWNAQGRVEAIGIASFGPVRVNRAAPDFGTILETPKPGWTGARVLDKVRSHFDCPIGLDTDVNGAALAEHAFGAAKDCRNMVYLTIGTGVGGGVLVDGQPLHGQMHPEVGHLRLRRAASDTFAGVCPFHGDCIEGLISGPALHARLPVPPAELDPSAEEWHAVGHDFAELLTHLMLTLSPERIVIGGGVTGRQPHLLERARKILPDLLSGYLGPADTLQLDRLVCPPVLGDNAGPLGALLLAAHALKSCDVMAWTAPAQA